MEKSETETRRIEEEVERVVEAAKELQDSASSLISKSWSEEQSLRQRALSLDSSIKRCHSLLSRNSLPPPLYNKAPPLPHFLSLYLHYHRYIYILLLQEDLQRAKCLVADGDAASFLPSKPQGKFLRMFLGPINVRASRKDVQLKVKEEYNSYRDRTALLFLLFPSVLLVLRSWLWNGCLPAFPVQLYQAWLLFLYTGLALRENILRANGSDIRPWWIYHHYCAMIMALVSLTWEIKGQPDCAQKQRGVQLFLQWAMMQGVAMLLQNRYQRQRLYTRIALGKAASQRAEEKEILANFSSTMSRRRPNSMVDVVMVQGRWLGDLEVRNKKFSYSDGEGDDTETFGHAQLAKRMDVVWGETAGVDGQLWLLCPLLFILQGFEAYVGLQLLRTAFVGVVTEWQVIFCGILLVFMAVGNFLNTVQTLIAKSRFKAKMKRSKSKPELE
ncbi:hypothetical protein Tsubulata_009164 [Turnera subulata]|uniref:TMPIT-like protein n=1 Tax=Turnera subulata TaxID=218843 RepID=A0A9Q0FID1_9ROSI|nr:hypothetical protein Tsubulata_009164 [Turnera subulata]